MNADTVTILVILVGGIAGYLILTRTWSDDRYSGRSEASSAADAGNQTAELESCYNDCMASAQWDPAKGDACSSICRNLDVHTAG
ncbi:MAG TPA: hypothetical protein VK463_08645 [Desulfomonilaceae bacterium]|nr:hypothetical protein [Desulfomonilaceae bacterium]